MAIRRDNGIRLDETQARRLLSRNLARLLARGSFTIRVRRLYDEDRLAFWAEDRNRWLACADMDYRGTAAQVLAETLLALGNKRGKDLHIQIHRHGHHDDITIAFHKQALQHHRNHLAQYVMGQLFWV
jgi:hypothetical protein